VITSIAERDALNQVEVAFRGANAVAQDYVESLSRTQGRELAGMGQGNEERNRLSGRNQIEDKYAQDARRNELFKSNLEASKGLDGGNAFGADARKKYDEENARIRDNQKVALKDYDDFIKAKKDREANWQLGASEGLQNYLDDTQNVYKSIGDVVGKAFKGMEDALVDFVKTGKLDFNSLAQSIISDMIRIQIQQSVMQPLGGALKSAGGLGGLFQAGKTLLGFAEGGDPPVGVPSMVGEKGPELFVPKVAGTIVPNRMLNNQANSSVVINQPLTINANNASAETVAQIRRLMPNFMAENKRVIMSVVQQAMQKKAGRLTA
jgi:phage-related minor tail protein